MYDDLTPLELLAEELEAEAVLEKLIEEDGQDE